MAQWMDFPYTSSCRRTRKPQSLYVPNENQEERHLRIALRKSTTEVGGEDTAQRDFSSILEEVPTIQPTVDEFRNPIELMERLAAIGEKFGVVKIRPPKGWKPPYSLDLYSSSSPMRFPIREQHLHKLQMGKAFTFPDRLWTFTEYQQMNEDFMASTFPDSQPSVDVIESEYWRIVETQPQPVTVCYAADLDVRTYGSGFPSPKSSSAAPHTAPATATAMEDTNGPEFDYASDSWNLLNLARSDGSLFQHFRYEDNDGAGDSGGDGKGVEIPGVTVPWQYFGMMFSTFCWHTEDNFFASINYQHWGAAKVWYVVPPSKATAMERLMKKSLVDTSKHKTAGQGSVGTVLHTLALQLSPSLLTSNKIPVYRIVQQANEFVVLWPRAFHAGLNTGLNCNEACNVAPPLWLKWGYEALISYRYYRPICVPHEQLVILAAIHYEGVPVDRLFLILDALIRLFHDEESMRRRSTLPQLPFTLSLAAYRQAIKKQQQQQQQKGDTESSQLPQEQSGEVEGDGKAGVAHMLHRMKQLALLRSPDCSNCQMACFTGCVMCPHTTDVVCLSCEKAHISNSAEKTVLYRFSLPCLRALVDLVSAPLKRHLDEQVKANPPPPPAPPLPSDGPDNSSDAMAIDPSPSNNGDGTSEAAVQESPSLCSSKRKRDDMDEGWNGNGDGDDASPADPLGGSTGTGGATSGKKATGKGRRGRGSKKGRKGLKDHAERASKERELFNVYQAAMKLPSLVDMIDFEAGKCPKRSGRTEVDTSTTVTTVGTVPRDVIISSLSEGVSAPADGPVTVPVDSEKWTRKYLTVTHKSEQEGERDDSSSKNKTAY